ncbi:MAG: four helix bundle protein [Patescibacteria group bacterium]
MSDFRKLLVWQKAMDLVAGIYKASEKFPSHEKFGLTVQMRRAAVSIPSNIAEGCERGSAKNFANFLIIARSSAGELETQILIAFMLKYIQRTRADELIKKVIEIRKMIIVLRKRILVTVNS